MKTRSGFVSNSSSSSFIYILSASKYEKLLTELDVYQKAVLEKLGVQRTKILDRDAVVVSGIMGNYSSFEDMEIELDEDFEPEYEKYSGEAFDKIEWPEGTYIGGENF